MTNLIVLAIIVAVIGYGIFLYNDLVSKRQLTQEGWSGIDVQLKRRTDLIPNLLETVKGYMGHERQTLEAVVEARAAATAGANATPEERAKLEGVLSGALGRLLAVAEAYPDLKANTNFQQLQTELSDIENKLAAARRFFNNAVSEFNAVRRQFPTVLFAGLVGFGSDKPFFDVGAADRATMTAAPPQVKF